MKNFVIVFISMFIINTGLMSCVAEDPVSCKNLTLQSPAIRLKKYLLCAYDYQLGPRRSSDNKINITLTFIPRHLEYDEHTSNVKLQGYLYIMWIDEGLKWDPALFENTKLLQVRNWEIWAPHVGIESAGNHDLNEHGVHNSICELYGTTGTVACIPTFQYTVRCQSDYESWPFDRQNCTLLMTSWAFQGEELRFKGSLFSTIFLDDTKVTGGWNIAVSRISYYTKGPNIIKNSTSPVVAIDFILDRVHNRLSGMFITPGIIMMTMTLTTLWLDPRTTERLAVALVNLLVHLMCLQDLHWTLPHNGETVPKILFFYIYSLLLCTFAFCLTLFLRKMQSTNISPPRWMSSTTALILRSRVGQILLLSMLDPKAAAGISVNADDTGDLVGSETRQPTWDYVAILLGWISFIGFFIAYAIMYTVLIPSASARLPINAFTPFRF